MRGRICVFVLVALTLRKLELLLSGYGIERCSKSNLKMNLCNFVKI